MLRQISVVGYFGTIFELNVIYVCDAFVRDTLFISHKQ